MIDPAAIVRDLAFVVGFAVGVLVWLLPSFLTARLADRKGRSFAGYLIASLFLCWPVVLLVVALLPRRGRAL